MSVKQRRKPDLQIVATPAPPDENPILTLWRAERSKQEALLYTNDNEVSRKYADACTAIGYYLRNNKWPKWAENGPANATTH